jgi:carboxylesterase type B
LIVGTNQDEAKLYTAMIPPEEKTDEEVLVRSVHRMIRFRGKNEDDAKRIIDIYRKTREGTLPTDPQNILDAFMTDFRFRISALRLAEAQNRASAQGLFLSLYL